MKRGSHAELVGFLRRYVAAFSDGGKPPTVRVLRKRARSRTITICDEHGRGIYYIFGDMGHFLYE